MPLSVQGPLTSWWFLQPFQKYLSFGKVWESLSQKGLKIKKHHPADKKSLQSLLRRLPTNHFSSRGPGKEGTRTKKTMFSSCEPRERRAVWYGNSSKPPLAIVHSCNDLLNLTWRLENHLLNGFGGCKKKHTHTHKPITKQPLLKTLQTNHQKQPQNPPTRGKKLLSGHWPSTNWEECHDSRRARRGNHTSIGKR